MNTLIIAENIITNKQTKILKLLSADKTNQILALDLNSISTLKKSSLEFITEDNLLNDMEKSQISLKSFAFAKLYSNQSNILNFKDIYLANTLNMPLLFALNSVIGINQTIENYLKTKPNCNNIVFFSSEKTFKLCKPKLLKKRIAFKFNSTCNKTDFLRLGLKDFLKFFICFAIKLKLKPNSQINKRILFYENLEKLGDIPDLLPKNIKPEIVYPKFSFKSFRECKRRGLNYSILPQPGIISYLISLYLINKQNVFLKKMIQDFFGNNSLSDQIHCLLMTVINNELPVLISELNYLNKTISQFSGCVTSNDTTAQAKLAVLISQKNNIPTLVIQHGVTTGGEISKINGSQIFGVGFLPQTADKMAVSGQISYDWLVNNNVDKDRLLITGLPQFDRYLNSNPIDISRTSKSKVCQNFALNPGKPIILFATQHSNLGSRLINYHLSPYENYSIIEAVTKALFPYKNKLTLVIKLHPASQDNSSAYANIIKTLGLDCIITKYYDTFSLVAASEIVITPWSTVGAEALLLNKQLITLNLTKRPEIMPYAEYKAAFSANSQKDLDIFFEKYMKNDSKISQDKISNFNKLYNNTNGKTAAENIAQAINNMTRCKHAECQKN